MFKVHFLYRTEPCPSVAVTRRLRSRRSSSWGRGGGRVDVGADERLADDREEAAFRLLAASSASVDEVVDVCGCRVG